MKRKEEYTKEEVEMYLRAIMEEGINANDLLMEVLPLLEEYFIADFELTKDSIIWEMLNGQKFKIIIEEI